MQKSTWLALMGAAVVAVAAGCTILSDETKLSCVQSVADYAKTCIVVVDAAACDQAKSAIAQCIADGGEDARDAINERIDEILAGLPFDAQVSALSGSKAGDQLLKYGELKQFTANAGK